MDSSLYLGGVAVAVFVYATIGLVWPKSMPRRAKPVGTAKSGETAPIRNIKYQDQLLVQPNDSVATLYDLLKNSSEKYSSKKAIGHRSLVKMHTEEKETIVTDDAGEEKKEMKKWHTPELSSYSWKNYTEFYDLVKTAGSALVSETLGLTPGSKVGIFCSTCPEWITMAHGAFTQSITAVTVYANLGEEGFIHAVVENKLTHIMCNADLLPTMTRVCAACDSIKYIIYVDKPVSEGDVSKIKAAMSDRVYSWDEFIKLGEKSPAKPAPPKADDLAIIMYTSGTTGAPKGVIMTHGNMIGAITGAGSQLDVLENDVYIAYLPLAHVLELVVENFCMFYGVPLGYANPRSLSDTTVKNCKGDLRELQPTIMCGVPAVWERIRKGAYAKIEKSSFVKRTLFKLAYAYKAQIIRNGGSTPLLDRIIFKPFHVQLGGRMRAILSGGAPISAESHKFLRVCFGIPVIQGYGLTETCGCTHLMDLSDPSYERVGAPIGSVEVKLIDVPDMKYFASENKGELLVKGTNICMNGYFNNEGKTAEDFKNGWFHTGDIAQFNSDGTFSIIDRKKNLTKLSHGEYIALEKLESTYKGSKLVENVMVYADSQRDYPIALVVPVKAELEAFASSKGLPRSWDKLCKTKEAEQYILGSLKEVGRAQGLKSFESVQKVILIQDEWTPENGMTTASMKIKRQPITEKFKKEIEEAYKSK